MPTLTDVRAVVVFVACDHCNEQGRVPGGPYRDQGEVINCPVCNGRKVIPGRITISDLKRLLEEDEK